MPPINAGKIVLNSVEHGSGDNVIVFLHGNLGCLHWMDLVLPLLPEKFHVYVLKWRGCGDSDKPEPLEDYSNYSIFQHAVDMIAALDSLGIKFCHLASHSTGLLIATQMLLLQPRRFGKVFCLDPVPPKAFQWESGK